MKVYKFFKKHYYILSSILLLITVFISLVALSKAILPDASRITVTVALDHSDELKLFYWNGLRKGSFDEHFSVISNRVKKNKKQKADFLLHDKPVTKVRLDLGGKAGLVKLYKIVVYSHFTKPVVYRPADIYRLFEPGKKEIQMSLRKDHVEIISHTDGPYLTSTKPLNSNVFLLYILPLIISVLLVLVIQRIDFSKMPSFLDINKKKPSSGSNVYALDGLRGIAALMVVADHTWGRFTGLGAGGVWIFMSLSGFLLARPFINDSKRAFSLKYWSDFFVRRVQRIVPIYYFYIMIIYVISSRFNEAIRHFLFVQGSGHLWVVPQEAFFYLLTPALMIVTIFAARNRPWLIVFGMTLLMVWANLILDKHIISLYGMTYKGLRPFVGIFLSGMIASYLYYGIYEPYVKTSASKHTLQPIFASFGVILLLVFLLGSTTYLWGGKKVFAQIYFPWFGVMAGMLLFAIVASEKTFFNRMLSTLPLRALGVVSFSFYLFHPLVYSVLKKALPYYTGHSFVGFPRFILTCCLSYVLACFLYSHVEKSFLLTKRSNKTL